ncbi:MAG: hypothetical protein ACO1N8_10000 [Methylophilus sp.]
MSLIFWKVQIIQLIDGKHGNDIVSALRTSMGPMSTKSGCNLNDYQNYERQEMIRVWAKSNIYSKTREVVPH